MTTYNGIPSQFYPDTGYPVTQSPNPGDEFILTGPTSLTDPYEQVNFAGTTEYLTSINGSTPSLSLLSDGLGNVMVHALPQSPDGTYETTNASIISSKGGSAIQGGLYVGGIGANGNLARANLTVSDGRPDAYMSLGGNINILPQSNLDLHAAGGGPSSISMGNTGILGGTLTVEQGVNVDDGNFDLESYFSTPQNTSPGIITMAGGISGGNIHVGIDTQLNLSGPATLVAENDPRAFKATVLEDPSSQVVLRGSAATSFSYQNGIMDVFNGGVHVADLHILPVNGGNSFSLAQYGPDTVISAVALSPQQLAQTAGVPAPVFHV